MHPGVCGASQSVAMTSTSPQLLGEVCLNEPIHSHNPRKPRDMSETEATVENAREDECLRDPGEVPVLDWIDKNLIDIDPDYQRRLDDARVRRIVVGFDWSSFGAIVVAPAGDSGRFNCTDGQHRLAAAKAHPAVQVVPAVIIP